MATKLYVGNLNYSTTQETLRNAFAPYGEVVSVKIIEGKGFGFVEFANETAANAAKDALNNTNIDGRSIKVNEARPQEKKPFSGGGGGFGGGGRRERY
ncbi:MAG: RNA-binding protein [Rhizobacter sp.]|nr:RNA-binding protein [Chlorobiales bacterium]